MPEAAGAAAAPPGQNGLDGMMGVSRGDSSSADDDPDLLAADDDDPESGSSSGHG